MTHIDEAKYLLPDSQTAVQTVRFAPNGLMFVGDVEQQLSVFEGPRKLYTLDLRTRNQKARTVDRIRSLAFAPDCSQFYVASGPTIKAFRMEDGKPLWSFGLPRFLGFLIACPLSIDVDQAGRVAVANDNGTFGIRDHYGRKLRCWKHNASPRWLAFSNDGNLLLGSDSFSLRAWDSETGEVVKGYDLSERVYDLAASRRYPLMAVRTLHEVQVFYISAESPLCIHRVEAGLPLVTFAEDQPLLAFSSEHGIHVAAIDLDDVSNQRVVFKADSIDATVLSIAFSHDGKSIVAGCSDGSVRSWNLP